MTATVHLVCEHCDAHVRPQRALFGYRLCDRCHVAASNAVICTNCGRNTYVLPGTSHSLCFRCERNDWFSHQTCKRCGRSLSTNARKRHPDGTASCSSCSTMLMEPVACHYCGKVGLKRSRDFQHGFTELACPKCMRDHANFKTCAGCHRNRPPAGERDGRPYCAHCYPNGAPPVITCAGCGKSKYQFNKDECEDCAWERSHQLLLKRVAPTFETAWARDLFEGYHREAKLKTLRGHWRNSLKRDVTFFQKLEQAFDRQEKLNGVLIVRRLGNDFVKKYRRGMSFLAHMNLIVMDDDEDFQVERSIDRLKQLTIDDADWIQRALDQFLTFLLNARSRIQRKRDSRIPTKPKSLESAVRAAHALLRYAGAEHGSTSIRDLSQETLDLFVGSHKRYQMSVAAFVRYTRRQRTFQPLKLRKVSSPIPPIHLVIPEVDRQDYLRTFAAVTAPKQLHWALVCLFNLLYAQLVERSVQLRMNQVREQDGLYEIKFAKVWMPLDETVQPLMRRWMSSRREFGAFDATNSSAYLFPGMRSGTHLTPSALQNFARKHGYNARAGLVTAIAVLIRNGLKQVKVLTDCFGLSSIRAQAYLRDLGAVQHRAARHAYDQHGRK